MINKQKTIAKRHCMVVHAYYPLGETRVERQAAALIARGYEVDVFCLREEGEKAFSVEQGANVYRLPVKRHKGRGSGYQLLEYLAFFILVFGKLAVFQMRRKYTAVQIHNLPDFLVFASLIPKLAGAQIILDIHDLMPEFFASKGQLAMNAPGVKLLVWQEWLSCKFAHRIITVTSQWRETLIRRGIPAEKIFVVMNVADACVFRPENQSVQIPTGPLKLIYHGTITKRYGVDLLLRAVKQAQSEVPDIQLTIHGSGEFYAELATLARTLGLANTVHFSTDFLPTADLPKLIQQAHIGIVPNLSDIFTDGILPTKLMEYVALGIPVVAARTPAIEAYFDETMVQFFTPGNIDELANCLITLNTNRQMLPLLAQRANRFNDQYSWEKVASHYIELVEALNFLKKPSVLDKNQTKRVLP